MTTDVNTDAKVESATAKKLEEERQKRLKNVKRQGMILVGLVAFGFLVKWMFTPFQGGMAYGVCKTFLELQVRYPHTLELSTVDETLKNGAAVRIWFSHVDPFGEYQLDNIECSLRPDPNTGAALDTVTISRRTVDPAKVEAFNKGAIYGLILNPPNLDLPDPLPENLENLQVDNWRLTAKLFQ